MAIRQITGGAFQDASGKALAGGSITFRLSTDAVASDSQVSAPVLTKATLDSNGNISGTVNIWPNPQLTPATVYKISVYNAQGLLAWYSENSIPSGVGSFDIGTLTPLF
ncbi:MAG: hypothetical protein C5B59_08650 [Bacteroidetes bacterium]|nr:MAG: hypothetical protein C5B59_08650 [Bacteroidota bacterium]